MVEHASLPVRRVVHGIYSGLGGHAAVMFALLEGGFLPESEHHVVLNGVEPPMQDYVDRLERLGIGWSYVGKEPGRGHLGFYRRLRAQFLAQQPDLIFLNGLAALPATVGLSGSRDGRRPMVLLRESEPVQLKSRFEWSELALAHMVADRIVHLTREAAEGAREKLRFVYRPQKVTIIPNAIDTGVFTPRPRTERSVTINIGMVSRIQHKKDHASLVAAFARIVGDRPELSLVLHIAGDGAMLPQVRAQIEELGLGDKVVLHGLLGREEIRDLMQRLDIYVHATFGETMSNSIMQAMASRLPIVASDVNGVNNMIGDDKYGLLYPSGDVSGLADAIIRFIDDPQLADRYAERARERAISEYDVQSVVHRYEGVVREFLSDERKVR